MARLLAPDARYTVTDLAQPMLDQAMKKQGADQRITWQQADALDLPFDDRSFDAVVCQFGVVFFPDKVACFGEARRVLNQVGSFIFNVWDRLETNDFSKVVNDAMVAAFPGDPPGFLAGAPYGYHDLDLIRAQLLEAGFSQVSIDTMDETSSAPSPRHPAIALCQGTPLRNDIETRGPGRIDEITSLAEKAIASHFGNGPVSGKIRGHVVTAVR